MTVRRRLLAIVAVVAGALVAPAAASAHAYLVKTVPSQNSILDVAPRSVQLTYDEAVEPRFAIISVFDVHRRQLATAPASRSPSNPDTLVVPLEPHLAEGWYLVYWRAISVDGHPVQGAYEFAVGPSAGPPPVFTAPHLSQTATTPRLVVARWIAFLSVMAAIGLFVFRIAVARPLVRRVAGTSLRPLTVAFAVCAAVALVAVPLYLDFATAIDSLRSVFDVGVLLPLFRVTAFGRAWLDLELCFALFCAAAAIALWVDRPVREHRSIAELFATAGAFAAAAAVLLLPGIAGHAAQTAPRGVSLLLDWSHLVSGSVWIGGLAGLLVLWVRLPAVARVAGLATCVPRFSNTAFVSVLILLASGIGATVVHMPILAALWQTSYGVAILVKIGLLAGAMLVAAVNLLRTKPHLVAAAERPELGAPAAKLLRRTVSVETVIVSATVLAAAVLSSLAPPPPALAQAGSALASVGPGPVLTTVHASGYALQVVSNPNTVGASGRFGLRITKNGKPLTGADVTLTFEMLDMQMGNLEYQLVETSPGLYTRRAPALVMAGRWALSFSVTPRRGTPFRASVIDHANG